MDRQTVSSSNIRSVGYDAENKILEVAFSSGGVYQYFNVPEHRYSRLMSSFSKGSYLADHIRNNYRYRKVG